MTKSCYMSDLCRCCHSKGSFRSLHESYVYEGQVEIYNVLMRETFDIVMPSVSALDSASTHTICVRCVERLRDAVLFKRQVLDCEQRLRDTLQDGSVDKTESDETKTDGVTLDTAVKAEDETTEDELQECQIHPDADRQLVVHKKNEEKPVCVRDELDDSKQADIKAEPSDDVQSPAGDDREDVLLEDCWQALSDAGADDELKTEAEGPVDGYCAAAESGDRPRTLVGEDSGTVVRRRTRNSDKKKPPLNSTQRKPIYILCDHCNMKFVSKDCLIQHITLHAGEKKYSCTICFKFFLRDSHLLSHLSVHSAAGEKNVSCQNSDIEFQSKSDLSFHNEQVSSIRFHTEQEIITSGLCNKQLRTKGQGIGSLVHEKDHNTDEKKFTEQFVGKHVLKRHKKLVHKATRSRFACDACNKTYSTRYGLKCHRYTHTVEKYVSSQNSVTELEKSSDSSCHNKEPVRGKFNTEKKATTEKNIVTCDICKKNFNFKKSLKEHLLIHAGVRHACDVCNKTYSSSLYLKYHRYTHSDENFYPCMMCTEKFAARGELMQHKRLVHNSRFACDACNKTYSTRYGLKRHQNTHTGEKDGSCENSFKELQKSSDSNFHNKEFVRGKFNTEKKTTIDKKVVTCDICKKNFKCKKSLKEHLLIHAGVRHACDVCNKTYSSRTYLRLHRHTHTGEKRFSCKVCKEKFVVKSELIRHNRVVHKTDGKFTCEVCGIKFHSKTPLNFHLDSHIGWKKYSCPVCKKKLSGKKYLRIHIAAHKTEHSAVPKLFVCDICGNEYKTKLGLTRHIIMHFSENTCKLCNKTFSHQSSFKEHMRIHKGERNFNCDKCGKTFLTKLSLKFHLHMHTGEKKITCDICNKSFARKDYIIKHFATVHAKKKPTST